MDRRLTEDLRNRVLRTAGPSVDAVLDQDSVIGPMPDSITFIPPTLPLTQIHFYIYQVESVSQFQLVLEPTCKHHLCGSVVSMATADSSWQLGPTKPHDGSIINTFGTLSVTRAD